MRSFLLLVLLFQSFAPISCFAIDNFTGDKPVSKETQLSVESEVDSLFQSKDSSDPDSLKKEAEYKKIVQSEDDTYTPEERVNAYVHLGDSYYAIGDFGMAYQYYSSGSQLAEKNMLSEGKALCLEGMGHIDWRTGDNIGSVSKILESIQIFTSLEDTTHIIKASDILAGVYMSMGKLDDAEKIFNEMLDFADRSNDSLRVAELHEHIGAVYFFRKDYDRAIRYYTTAQQINTMYNKEVPLGINYANIGEAYDYKGDYTKALEYFKKSYTLLSKHHFNSGLIFIYYGMGRCYTNLQRLDEGMQYYRKSLQLIEETGERREKPFVYELMAINYTLHGDYKNAYEYDKKRDIVKDSIENLEKDRQVEEIKARFEIDKKERINEQLKKENENRLMDIERKQQMIFFQFILVSLMLLLIVLLAYLYFKINTQKKQLKKANETKNRLLSIIGHDLRGPVGNLKGLTEVVVKDESMELDPQVKALFGSLNDSINSAYFLLNDLLTWSQLQKEGLKFHFKKLNAKEQSLKVTQIFEFNESKKQLKINNTIPEDVFVKADENALQTVLRNLISNAIKFTPEQGEIVISSTYNEADKYVTILVKDTGIGIEEEKLKQLFVQENLNVTYGTSNETGRGIGLTICKEFVERGGGKIGVISEPGHGSTFYFTIPVFKN